MGRSPSCVGEAPLKKGPWSGEEDRLLVDYIKVSGTGGNWRTFPKRAGLNRCGKSCRLRWTNYLRPDIKRGVFTDEEEKTIIHLHSMLGNKWSAIATHLPGRTGNFIKNYWNTNLCKKLLHTGIDPDTHRPRTDLSLLTVLRILHAAAPGNGLLYGISMGSSAWDMNAPRPNAHVSSMNTPEIKEESTSFTGSYSDMNTQRIKDEAAHLTGNYLNMNTLRVKDEATSFTGSYSGACAEWDMNTLYRIQADAAKFQLLQGYCWVISAALGTIRPLVGKLEMLLLAPSSLKLSSKRVKEGMRLLKDDVEEISSYLDELSEVEDPPPMAICWMNEARELSYDMEDYIDSLLFVPPDNFNKNKKKKRKKKKMMIKKRLKWYRKITQVSEHGIKTSKCIHVSVVPRLPKKPKTVETVSEFRIYVQEAVERHDRYKLHCCSNLRRHTFLSTDRMLPMPYEETDDHIVIDGRMNEFINSLAANDAVDQQQLKVVSVLGSGCLGKTTLAKVLYNRIMMQFDCRAFIRVPKKPDMKRLLRDLFSQLYQKQPRPANCNELGISNINIRKHLQDKRYLIVIDDLWNASVWDIIKYAFPEGNHGSRIIITTQIEDVALTCCCDHSEHVFEMKPLDNDHSRKLFFNRLFGSENDCPVELKQVSNEIIEICGGLPLATINIASHLANQQAAVSLDMLTCIRDSLTSPVWSSSTSERTRQVLNLSYNNLPHHLKTCLLYLHMYLEGSIIWKDDLVKQWVAEGFIATRKGKEADQDQDWMEKSAGIYFDELIDRRFIQPSCMNYNNKVLSCTVHDVVRDLIAHKSAEENFIVAVDCNRKSIAIFRKVRRLSLVFGDANYAKTPANITMSQVRSLTFFGLFECMPCIREFKVLRVLNLQLCGHHGDHDPIDLTGISVLFQLRYLKIASDVCVKLPNSMRELKCLETLDLMDATRVTAVPWDIIYLPHLLHLTLPVDTNLLDWIGSMTDSVISLWSLGKLNYLQDLHLTSSSSTPLSSDQLKRSMEVVAHLMEGHGNLKTIVVSHGSSVKHIVVPDAQKVIIQWDNMAPPPLLQRFEFSPHSCCIFSQIPQWVEKHGNLCILKIPVRELKIICIDILRGLHALSALSLYVEMTPIHKIIFEKAAGFSVLKYFKLKFMTGIACIKFEANAMPSILKLKIVFNAIQPMGHPIFSGSGKVQHRHGSEVINIEHMPGIREISTKFGGAVSDLEHASRIIVSNHPSNPTINMQLVGYSSNVDRSTKHKKADDILEEQPDECDKRLERSVDKRISTSPVPSSSLDDPGIIPKPTQFTGGSDEGREHMFDKVVTPTDVGKLNRLVVPKQHAEKYFPLDVLRADTGLLLNLEDRGGKLWRFRYSYWKSSQSYVLTKGWSRFVKEKCLNAGDILSFCRGATTATRDRLFIDWKHGAERQPLPMPTRSPFSPCGAGADRFFMPPAPAPRLGEHHRFHQGLDLSSINGPPELELTIGMPMVLDSAPKDMRLFGVNLDKWHPHDGESSHDAKRPAQFMSLELPQHGADGAAGAQSSAASSASASPQREAHSSLDIDL